MALTPKDRRALFIGISTLALFLLVQFVVLPLLDKRKRLDRGISIRQKGLVEMQEMQSRYAELSRQSNTLEQRVSRRSGEFSLFSFLEKMAAEAEVKDNIAYMKPSDATGDGVLQQSMVEMKLKAINLKQLVSFLERIESPENIVELKRISIQENKKQEGTLDVIMQVICLVLAENGAA
ncbi:MAG: type II secretion system protein M [Deltaproteobacteria bacterium]|jgi:general secretion pathway protein M|nr:type II secretion system protein M [Deltaproteobacteria bacterium]